MPKHKSIPASKSHFRQWCNDSLHLFEKKKMYWSNFRTMDGSRTSTSSAATYFLPGILDTFGKMIIRNDFSMPSKQWIRWRITGSHQSCRHCQDFQSHIPGSRLGESQPRRRRRRRRKGSVVLVESFPGDLVIPGSAWEHVVQVDIIIFFIICCLFLDV